MSPGEDSTTAAYDPRAHGARCDSCPLNGQPVVPPTPSFGKTRLAIVGEAPGKIEVKLGGPFMGPSGKLLDKILDEVGFDRRDALVTNAVLCRLDDEKTLPRATACCSMRLAEELAALPSQAPVLALGASAAKATIGKGGILKARGFIWKIDAVKPAALKAAQRTVSKRRATRPTAVNQERLAKAESSLWLLQARNLLRGLVVIPSLHPAFLLRGADAWAPLLRVDVNRAVRYARHPLKLEDDVAFVETADVAVVRRHLARLPRVVSLDVETDGPDPLHAKLDCIGVIGVDVEAGVLRGPALVMKPWRRAFGVLLNKALKTRVVVGHNLISFDETVCRRYGIHFAGGKEDTLLAHHSFASHVRQGLDHVASVYCDAQPWKHIHKSRGADEKGLGFAVKELARYNSSDCGLTGLAWIRMQPDLAKERSVYEGAKRLAEFCTGMQRAGLRVDIARRDYLARKLRSRAAGIKGEMRKLVGRPTFNPRKTADLRWALFQKFKSPLLALTPTGVPSTASGTLEALQKTESKAGILSDLVIRYRACEKTVSTFLEGINIAGDGRVHASWRAFGTVTQRLSCRDPNLQNLVRRVLLEALIKMSASSNPLKVAAAKARIKELGDEAYELESRVREIYIASPGKAFVYFDLGQSEMRAAAYLSGDSRFISSCESGDVHTANAIILFPDALAELADPKGAGKPFRDVTKNAGFGILYDATVATIYSFLQSKGFDVALADVEAMFAEIRSAYARYYEFCEENLDFCRKHGHLREALSGRIRWFGFYPKPTEIYNFCLDDKTEALTRNGWVKGFDLKAGDVILTKNIDTGLLEWKPVARMNHVNDYTGELVEFKSQSFSAVTTPNHRWMVRDRRRMEDLCVTTEELADGRGDYSIHRTGTYPGASAAVYTDDYVELVGWVLTDGNIDDKGVRVYQIARANERKVARIDALMKRMGCRSRYERRGIVTWVLSNVLSVTHTLRRMFPGRVLTYGFMDALTSAQLNRLLETMIDGDGCRTGGTSFFCRDEERADAFAALCVMCGKAVTVTRVPGRTVKKLYRSMPNKPKGHGGWLVTVLRRQFAQVLVHKKRYGRHKKRIDQVKRRFVKHSRVWCPVVANSYFVARREGKVFVTGNSVQAFIAALMNDRLLAIDAKLPRGCRTVAQVHDSGVIETPLGLVDDVKELITDTWKVPVHVPTSGRDFVMPIDLKVGDRLSDF